MNEQTLVAINEIVTAIDTAINTYGDGKLQLLLRPLIKALRALIKTL